MTTCGKPRIRYMRDMRVTVGMIVGAIAVGRTIEHPYLEEPSIREAPAFAARLAQGHEIRLTNRRVC